MKGNIIERNACDCEGCCFYEIIWEKEVYLYGKNKKKKWI